MHGTTWMTLRWMMMIMMMVDHAGSWTHLVHTMALRRSFKHVMVNDMCHGRLLGRWSNCDNLRCARHSTWLSANTRCTWHKAWWSDNSRCTRLRRRWHDNHIFLVLSHMVIRAAFLLRWRGLLLNFIPFLVHLHNILFERFCLTCHRLRFLQTFVWRLLLRLLLRFHNFYSFRFLHLDLLLFCFNFSHSLS